MGQQSYSEDMAKTREHKHISPTAFGHIYFRSFYKIPLAAKMLAAMQGKSDNLAAYTENKAIIPIMEARYKGGEEAIEAYIREHPNAQIMELAAGFSLHGATLAKKYPAIDYFETDLPDIVAVKKEAIDVIIPIQLPNLHHVPANALDLEVLKNIAGTDQERPLVIYNEGLMSYLTDAEKLQLADAVKGLLKNKAGVWITPDPALSAERRHGLAQLIPDSWKSGEKKVEEMTKQKYDDYVFRSEEAANEFFRENGFTVQTIPQPTELNSFDAISMNPEFAEKLKDNIKYHGKIWLLQLNKNNSQNYSE